MKLYALPPLIQQTIVWPITRPFLWFFTKLKVTGLENLKGLKRGVIFAVNHSSELDPILIPASLPFISRFKPMFYIAAPADMFRNFGWKSYLYTSNIFFESWGAYRVLFGVHDYNKSLSKHIKILNDRQSVLIFPEGKRTRDGELLKPKGGVGYLLAETNCPVVPVAISGSLNSSLGAVLSMKKNIKVSFGKPLNYGDVFTKPKNQLAIDDYKIGAEKIFNEVSNLLNNTK